MGLLLHPPFSMLPMWTDWRNEGLLRGLDEGAFYASLDLQVTREDSVSPGWKGQSIVCFHISFASFAYLGHGLH
nr:hypothetical protein CFP56_49180 [Quercus suber]